MGYYKVHCVKCGNKFSSSVMAFDFDRLLKRSLEINQNFDIESELDSFKEIKLGLYYTYFQLQSIFGVKEEASRVRITARDILEFVNDKYKVDLEADFYLADDFIDDGFSSVKFKRFSDRLQTFHGNKDIDRERKLSNVESICRYLVEHKDDEEPVLECTIKVELSYNDTPEHDLFASGMEVIYADGKTKELVDHMVCIHCGSPMYKDAGKYQEFVIGMLGSARVGKTAYLAALINDLKPERGRTNTPNIKVISDNDFRWQNFEQMVLKPYRGSKKIQKTEVVDEMVSLFTARLLINDRNYLFTFVDMPGEAFVPSAVEGGVQDFSFIIEKRPILKHTDIFWFCIDPVQIDVRLENQNGAESSDDRVETNMNTVIGYIRPVLGYLNDINHLKAAVMLTKADLVPKEAGLFEPERGLQMPLVEGTAFRWDRFVNWAQNVKRYFEDDNVTDLESDFKVMFRYYNYFAVAAYGRTVKTGTQEDGSGNLPSHIKDPFFWTLAVLGILKPMAYEVRETGRFIKKKEEGLWPVNEAYLYTR